MKMQKYHISTFLVFISVVLFLTVCTTTKTPTEVNNVERETQIQTLVESAGDYVEPDTSYTETYTTFEELRADVLYICNRKSIDASLARGKFTLFDPNSEVIWPGCALQGKSIQYATPDPIVAPRSGGKLVINNLTGTLRSSVEVEKVTLSNILDAANQIIRNQTDKFPAQLSLSYTRVRSKKDLALALSAGGGFFGIFEANSNFELEESSESITYLVTLFQTYYTLIFERPEKASNFFRSDVTADDLKPFIGHGNYPVYVSSVTYGRVYYFLISSSESVTKVSAAVSASFDLGFLDVGGSGYYNQVKDLKLLRVQAWAYGGDTGAALNAITGNLYKFLEQIKNDADIRLAKPVSYTIRTVRSATLVKNEIFTKFTVVSDCHPYQINELNILFEPPALYFGCVEFGSTVYKNLKISNKGSIDLNFELIPSECGVRSLSGSRPICFKISPTEPFLLRPGEWKNILVKFSPWWAIKTGSCKGELECPMTVKIRGKGTEIETNVWIIGSGSSDCP